mgnify:CR=1 FL=1
MFKIPKNYKEAKKWIRPMVLTMALLPIAFLYIANYSKKTSLPKLFEVPAFELIDQEDNKFLSQDMLGELWMVNFFFTKCTSVCPIQTSKLKTFKDRYPELEIQTISITVDPKNDNVETLAEYSQGLTIDSKNWKLLTGTEEVIRRVVVEGFKSGMEVIKNESLFDIAHANYLLMVDREGFVRAIVRFDEENFEEKIIAIYENL